MYSCINSRFSDIQWILQFCNENCLFRYTCNCALLTIDHTNFRGCQCINDVNAVCIHIMIEYRICHKLRSYKPTSCTYIVDLYSNSQRPIRVKREQVSSWLLNECQWKFLKKFCCCCYCQSMTPLKEPIRTAASLFMLILRMRNLGETSEQTNLKSPGPESPPIIQINVKV